MGLEDEMGDDRQIRETSAVSNPTEDEVKAEGKKESEDTKEDHHHGDGNSPYRKIKALPPDEEVKTPTTGRRGRTVRKSINLSPEI